MKKITLPLLCGALVISACTSTAEKNEASLEKWTAEIRSAESEFAAMAASKGIPAAFLEFAADDAVLLRNNNLIVGKEALRASYEGQQQGNGTVSLSWSPDFVDVSSSGDLGYTYGKYTYTVTDSLGKKNTMEGIFHTVWKRQEDGRWKFVWD